MKTLTIEDTVYITWHITEPALLNEIAWMKGTA